MLNKLITGLAVLAALFTTPAIAGEGHDHGDAPAAATGPALPRFAASSELFELVGVVDGKRLTVWLDRFDDNAPVKGATIELEVGGAKLALESHADGEFEGVLARELPQGLTPVTATVVAGQDSDLLAAEIDIHDHEHGEAANASGSRRYVAWGLAAAAALALLAWIARRKLVAHRVGGAA